MHQSIRFILNLRYLPFLNRSPHLGIAELPELTIQHFLEICSLIIKVWSRFSVSFCSLFFYMLLRSPLAFSICFTLITLIIFFLLSSSLALRNSYAIQYTSLLLLPNLSWDTALTSAFFSTGINPSSLPWKVLANALKSHIKIFFVLHLLRVMKSSLPTRR